MGEIIILCENKNLISKETFRDVEKLKKELEKNNLDDKFFSIYVRPTDNKKIVILAIGKLNKNDDIETSQIFLFKDKNDIESIIRKLN